MTALTEPQRAAIRLSPTRRRALEIIRDISITSPRQFALLMWPDNPGWQRHGKSGYGQAKGVGMRLAGGGYLGKLQRAGLIQAGWDNHPYSLTAKGLAELYSAESED